MLNVLRATRPVPDPEELDELAIARAVAGDRDASRALVERYQQRVFALVSRMLAGRGRAIDPDFSQSSFQLHVVRAGKDRVYYGSGNAVTVPGSELSEGEHELWYERELARDHTRLQIKFDATAPQIHFDEPTSLSGRGQMAIGWKLKDMLGECATAAGCPFAYDGTLSRAPRGVSSVGFVHPRLGTHYYIVREK
jgi:hypothetical protein